MFKILVFLIALEPFLLTSWLGLVCLSSGKISDSIPFLAISLMSLSYLAKGAVETFELVKSRLK